MSSICIPLPHRHQLHQTPTPPNANSTKPRDHQTSRPKLSKDKKPFARKGVVQIAEIANRLIDPILAKRAGISTLLLAAWDEIVGRQFSRCSRPDHIRWPRQSGPDERGGGFAPGVLTVACEGARALFLMHQEKEIIGRVNNFFGFPAIARIRIVQKAVSPPDARPGLRPLDLREKKRLSDMLAEVEDPRLRQSLERLGSGVIGRRPRQG